MIRGGKRSIAVCVLVVALLGGSAYWRDSGNQTSAQKAADYAADLKSKVTVDAVMTHLAELQKIADANGGTRVAGSPG